jgi:hypothetical protein
MSTEKRSRGRPPGTGKDDRKVLESVADMVVANPTMRPTTAMRRVAPKATEAEVRRFQVKWKEGREVLLNAARERTEAKRLTGSVPARRSRPQAGHVGGVGNPRDLAAMTQLVREVLDNPAAQMARELANSPAAQMARELANSPAAQMAREMANSPAAQMARELANTPAAQMAREMANSPAAQMAREIANSPAAQMARELANSPAARLAREMENSATMRALRDLDSPTMRAIRQHQEMMDRLTRGY